LISPRASACLIMELAARSLTEPAGLLPSSLANMILPRCSDSVPGIRCSRTSGVAPMVSSIVGYFFMQKSYTQQPDKNTTAGSAWPQLLGLGTGSRRTLTGGRGWARGAQAGSLQGRRLFGAYALD